jgi:enterochelin esterase-like enzyme
MKNWKVFILAAILAVFGIIIAFPSCNNDNDKDKDNNMEEENDEGPVDFDAIYNYLNGLENFTPPADFDKKISGNYYGTLTEKAYYSTTTQANRSCMVYTPRGYNSKKTYPVLYLLHGIGGNHREWLNDCNPDEIISNLITLGEAKPMIVVMPNVRAKKNDNDYGAGGMYGQENSAAFDNFINDLRDDLMPFIKENYKVSDNREKCAIAGLSMGGREALFIGVKMPETFAYIGAFSAAPGLIGGQLTAEEMTLPDAYKNNTFIMLNVGNDDGIALSPSISYHEAFEDNGIRNFFYRIGGGHDFKVWNNGLYYFAKCIF